MGVQFQKRVLPGGLTVIAEVDPSAHSAAAGFFVRTGARDEPREVMGVSHFLEHMMFKGYGDVSSEALNAAFDDMGASNNAYTSHEVTCFHARVTPDRTADALELLARMLRPALRTEDFDTEKQVILEEIAMYKDNPYWVLADAANDRHYGAHSLGYRVLGTEESVGAMTPAQMGGYFERRYGTRNTVVALAGNLDFDAACDLLAATCSDWKPGDSGRDTAAPRVGGGGFVVEDAKVTRTYMLGMARGASDKDDRRYAAMLAAQVLGGGDNSRLHWALIEPGIAEEAWASFDAHDGIGDFALFASGDPDEADRIWEVALAEARALGDKLTEDDLTKVRSRIATAAAVHAEKPSDRMQRIGRHWSARGEYVPLSEELGRVARVDVKSVRGYLADFPIEPTTWGRLTPARA